MDLVPGIDDEHAIALLIQPAQEVENLRAYGSGGQPNQSQIFASKYLSWVDDAEAQQRGWWTESSWLTELHTPRWQTITNGDASPRLINGEIDHQSHRLRTLSPHLGAARAQQASGPQRPPRCP